MRLGWLVMALFFSYIALDDGAALHERLGSTFRVLQQRAPVGAAAGGEGLLDVFPSYAVQVARTCVARYVNCLHVPSGHLSPRADSSV